MLAVNSEKINTKTADSTNEWSLDRQGQMYAIMLLTAASMAAIYGLVGVNIGEGKAPAWLWIAEGVSWSIRALVEAWALIYLFQTRTDDKTANRVLIVFEAVLIGLTCLVIGLTIFSARNELGVYGLSTSLFVLWSFSVASFAPLMLGAVGYAYKHHCEPIDQDLAETVKRLQDENKNLQTDNSLLQDDYKALLSDKGNLETEHKSLSTNYKAIANLGKYGVIDTLNKDSDPVQKREAVVMLAEQFPNWSHTAIADAAFTSRQTVAKWLGGDK